MFTSLTSWKYEDDVRATFDERSQYVFSRAIAPPDAELMRQTAGATPFHLDPSMRASRVERNGGGGLQASASHFDIDDMFRTPQRHAGNSLGDIRARFGRDAAPVHGSTPVISPFQHFTHISEPAYLLRDRLETREPDFPLGDPLAHALDDHIPRDMHTAREAKDAYLARIHGVGGGGRRAMGAPSHLVAPPIVLEPHRIDTRVRF